jgi:hypothetical protein
VVTDWKPYHKAVASDFSSMLLTNGMTLGTMVRTTTKGDSEIIKLINAKTAYETLGTTWNARKVPGGHPFITQGDRVKQSFKSIASLWTAGGTATSPWDTAPPVGPTDAPSVLPEDMTIINTSEVQTLDSEVAKRVNNVMVRYFNEQGKRLAETAATGTARPETGKSARTSRSGRGGGQTDTQGDTQSRRGKRKNKREKRKSTAASTKAPRTTSTAASSTTA